MKITLFLEKSIEENASLYFDKAKKARKKKEGAMEVIKKAEAKLLQLYVKEETIVKKQKRTKEWFEKFHWFMSSEEFLCIGGRDATTNDILIKKHMDQNDLVFHTNIAGSPFFVIKAVEGKKIGDATIKETAEATASYSRAWKLGLPTTEVFYVTPDQVSLTPKAGEYLEKGSFMIYGKTMRLQPLLHLAIGVTQDGRLIGGPANAVKAHSSKYLLIEQGGDKPSDMAKKIKKLCGYDDLDDIIRLLPTNGKIIDPLRR